VSEPAPEIVSRSDGTVLFVCAGDGSPLRTEQDALDIIGPAMYGAADIAVIPVERMDQTVFDLSTRALGEFVQKFANYRLPVAFLGDLAAHAARSSPLADFVRESNRGTQVWFLADRRELDDRLDRRRQ
jgi:Domain of unknown function (DUF4180)